MSDESKPKTDFHNFADSSVEVLLVKRIPQGRKTHGGFLWPSGVGTVVECPDWNNRCECGGGLHAWPWGFGIGDGCDYDIIGDIWLVLGAKPEDIVGELERGTKCKAKRVTIRLEGNFKAAMDFVRRGFDACVAAMAQDQPCDGRLAVAGHSGKASVSGDYGKASVSGDYGKASVSGHSGKASVSGHSGKASVSGDSGQASVSGQSGKASVSGHSGQASVSGHSGQASVSGDSGQASVSGDSGKASVSGHYGQASVSGDYGKASVSGDYGKASVSGHSGQASVSGHSGQASTEGRDTLSAVLGMNGLVRVGERGAFALAYFDDNDGWRFLTGKVGENGIKANTWYEIKDGVIAEAK